MAETADERFAENFRKRRELLRLSQTDVAEKMTERGFAFHQQTVAKIERGTRRVGIGEATELANILDLDISALLMPTDVAMTERHLYGDRKKIEKLYEQIIETSIEVIRHQFRLQGSIRRAEKFTQHARIRRAISYASRALDMTPDRALMKAVENLANDAMRKADESDDIIDKGLAAARVLHGDRPEVGPDATTWLEIRDLTASLIRRYRRLWWDPRSFLTQHLILVWELNRAGLSVSEIGKKIGATPEYVEAMISDGNALWEAIPEMKLDERFSRDAKGDEDNEDG